MTSWLSRQRKQTLLDLSSEAGLKQDEDSRKDEIVEALDSYLQQNATRLGSVSAFEPYYGTRRTPFKARSSSTAAGAASDEAEVKSVVKGRGRRATKVKQEFDNDEASASSPHPVTVAEAENAPSSARRTPGRPRRTQLPASPADVAAIAEYESSRFIAGLDDLYSVSGIPSKIEDLREICSSVHGIQMTFLALETLALHYHLIPFRWIADTPAIPLINLPSIGIHVPDLFALLSSKYWLPTLLWAATSIFVPTVFAYFYNLTRREIKRHGVHASVARYPVDPVIFNVVKALLTYVVYSRPTTPEQSYINPDVHEAVRNAMPLGRQGMLIGCYVTILATLHEATQSRR